jgi:hypothetical protein
MDWAVAPCPVFAVGKYRKREQKLKCLGIFEYVGA